MIICGIAPTCLLLLNVDFTIMDFIVCRIHLFIFSILQSDQLYYDKASQNGTMKSRKFVNARIRDVGEVNGAPIHIGPNRGASTYI